VRTTTENITIKIFSDVSHIQRHWGF